MNRLSSDVFVDIFLHINHVQIGAEHNSFIAGEQYDEMDYVTRIFTYQ